MFEDVYFSKIVGTKITINHIDYFLVNELWFAFAGFLVLTFGLAGLISIKDKDVSSLKIFTVVALAFFSFKEIDNKFVIKLDNGTKKDQAIADAVYKTQGYSGLLTLNKSAPPVSAEELKILLDKKSKTYTDVSLISKAYETGLVDVPKNKNLAKVYADAAFNTEIREASAGNFGFLQKILNRIDLNNNDTKDVDLLYSSVISNFLKNKKLTCAEADTLYGMLKAKEQASEFAIEVSDRRHDEYVKKYINRFNLIFAPVMPFLDKYTYSECVPVYNKYH